MGWSSAIANIAMTLYRFYGDKTILENVYDAIVRFVDFNLKRAGKLNPFLLFKRYKYRNMIIETGFHYGEWLEPGSKMFRDYIRDLFYPDTEVTTAWFYMTVRQLVEDSKPPHVEYVSQKRRSWAAALCGAAAE